MKKLLLITLFFYSLVSLSQEKTKEFKTISGYVSSDTEYALIGVHVHIKGTKKGYITDKSGYYEIKAQNGQILVFSFVGYNTKEVLIEPLDSKLNITLSDDREVLDEVTIKSTSNSAEYLLTRNDRRIINNSSKYISHEQLFDLEAKGAHDVTEVVLRSFPAMRRVIDPRTGFTNIALNNLPIFTQGNRLGDGTQIPLQQNNRGTAFWNIDGIIYNDFVPMIDFHDIKYIAIQTLGNARGTIFIRTGARMAKEKHERKKRDSYKNQTLYKDDAIALENFSVMKPSYIVTLSKEKSLEKAFSKYQEIKKIIRKTPEFYLESAKYFKDSHKDYDLFLSILNDMEKDMSQNEEALRALAYTYQEERLYKKAIGIYREIANKKIDQPQAQRDLANAYVEDKQYKNAWKVYKNYLQQGNRLNNDAISKIIYKEMEALYSQKKEIAGIQDILKFTDKPVENDSDIRVVFEWNDDDAEFALEFVNPKKQSYTVEHSKELNYDLLKDQKKKGYFSKEIVIDNIDYGNWLVNLTYLGNKNNIDPVYMKVTTYGNWSRPNQTKQVKVYKLIVKDQKTQLMKVTPSLLAYQ